MKCLWGLDPTVWLALATVTTAIIALVGVVLSLRAQKKREREQWLPDRRFEAYSQFTYCASEIGSATLTRGQVWHQPESEPSHLLDTQAKWEKAHQEFNVAQHRAVLIAGSNVADMVSKMSECVDKMIEAGLRASRKGDITTGTVSEGDVTALEDMEVAGQELDALRITILNEVLNLPRKSGHNEKVIL